MTNKQEIALMNKVIGKPSMPILRAVHVERGCARVTNLDVYLYFKAPEMKRGVYMSDGKHFSYEDMRIDEYLKDDFPAEMNFKSDGGKVKLLASTIHDANLFASRDENRYILNGVYLCKEDKCIVATDGRRLLKISKIEIPLSNSVIIPASTIKFIPKKAELSIEYDHSTKRVKISWKDAGKTYVLISKVVEGNYPNYKQVIPKEEFPHKVIMNKSFEAYFKSLRAGAVKIIVFSKKGMRIEEKKFDYDKPSTLKTNDQIALNPRFILDAMKIGFETFKFKDELTCIQLLKGDREAIIMPLRLK